MSPDPSVFSPSPRHTVCFTDEEPRLQREGDWFRVTQGVQANVGAQACSLPKNTLLPDSGCTRSRCDFLPALQNPIIIISVR